MILYCSTHRNRIRILRYNVQAAACRLRSDTSDDAAAVFPNVRAALLVAKQHATLTRVLAQPGEAWRVHG